MKLTYFDARRELKRIYWLGVKAIKQLDNRYTIFLTFELDKLQKTLADKFDIDNFGLYLINKEIKQIKAFLAEELKKKTKVVNETKSKASTPKRN
jgi:hypothetical protein